MAYSISISISLLQWNSASEKLPSTLHSSHLVFSTHFISTSAGPEWRVLVWTHPFSRTVAPCHLHAPRATLYPLPYPQTYRLRDIPSKSCHFPLIARRFLWSSRRGCDQLWSHSSHLRCLGALFLTCSRCHQAGPSMHHWPSPAFVYSDLIFYCQNSPRVLSHVFLSFHITEACLRCHNLSTIMNPVNQTGRRSRLLALSAIVLLVKRYSDFNFYHSKNNINFLWHV